MNKPISVTDPDRTIAAPPVRHFAFRSVADLKTYDRNSRTHGEAQIAQIAASIREFGFNNPVLIDEQDTIIAGEGRLLAAKKLQMPMVPCVVLAGLTVAQKAAYVIADNKLGLSAGWDNEALEAELDRLATLDFDLTLTGFNEVELAALLEVATADVDKLDIVEGDTPPDAGQQPTPDGRRKGPDAQTEWRGMPDFSQPEAGPFRSITVHFKDREAVEAFAQLIGQRLTEKAKWIWYPEAVRDDTKVVYG